MNYIYNSLEYYLLQYSIYDIIFVRGEFKRAGLIKNSSKRNKKKKIYKFIYVFHKKICYVFLFVVEKKYKALAQ